MEMARGKVRWGELDEEDGEDFGFLLPPRQVIGPDEKGMKKVIVYKFDEQGRRIKVTTSIRVRKVTRGWLSKAALERRSWAKFGDSLTEEVASRLTMISTEEIIIERPRQGNAAEETKAPGDPLAAVKGAVLMVCRACGKKGDHWTSKCPYKDFAQPTESFTDKPTDSGAPSAKNTYVPPTLRGGNVDRSVTEVRRRNDENSVRVTNLSEDTKEPDLLELFRSFGPVTRVYVAVDQRTSVSRGFGFVNFVHRDDAEKAISKLNGYGYDNLILKVEWATPRPN